MDRRTRKYLAQVLQQKEQRGVDASAQSSPLVDRIQPYVEILDRLTSVRRIEPTPRLIAAGRERLLSALSTAHRRRGIPTLFLTPVLRSAAIVLGLVVLSGAAAGTSWALGGPNLWPGKADRDSDRAIERTEDAQPNMGSDGESIPDTGTVDDGNDEASTGDDGDGQTAPDSDETDDEMIVGEDSPQGDDAPDDGTDDGDGGQDPADPTEGADDSGEDEGEESEEQSVDIETDVPPSPLQYRLQMAYDEDAPATTDDDRNEDFDADDSGNDNTIEEESTAEGLVVANSSPGQGIANEGGKGPGQNGQQPSGR